MKKILYLTFNDAPSGIYAGQVIDVCDFLSEHHHEHVRLVAFVSMRNFFATRQSIRAQYDNATVLPMFPKARNWRANRLTLFFAMLFRKPEVIIARGPFACCLALDAAGRKGRRICFDARGAYEAELHEYNAVPDEKVKAEVAELEKRAIFESDMRLAVSGKLVDYWKERYQYNGNRHVVIPCTLTSHLAESISSEEQRAVVRAALGFQENDIVLVYSGSSAGWQSMKDFAAVMMPAMEAQPRLKVLLLSKANEDTTNFEARFAGRVRQRWVKAWQVPQLLEICDYGWLVREDAVTNQVASPVKFAEYLLAGLHVLISEKLGDYSAYVQNENAGKIVQLDQPLPQLEKISPEEKNRIHQLALRDFFKSRYSEEYKKLLGN